MACPLISFKPLLKFSLSKDAFSDHLKEAPPPSPSIPLTCLIFLSSPAITFYIHLLIYFLSVLLLVSYWCCNKLPQTWCLEQGKFIILEFRRSKIWNGPQWATIKISAGLCSYWRIRFLAFVILQQPLHSLAFVPLPSPKSAMAGQVLLTWHHSDTHFLPSSIF